MAHAWTLSLSSSLSLNVASRVSSHCTRPTTTVPTRRTMSTQRTRRSSTSSVLLWEAHCEGGSGGRSSFWGKQTTPWTTRMNDDNDNHNPNNDDHSCLSLRRRHFLHQNARRLLLVPLVLASASAPVWTVPQAVTAATPSATTLETVDQLQPVVTDRIRFDVRIARQDGTFYVRDDLPDTPENQVFTGQFTVELFGQVAPETCRRFLSYVPFSRPSSDSNNKNNNNNNNNLLLAEPDEEDATALPTYGRSLFPSYDDATGLIVGGKIPGLQLTQIGSGTTALQYGSRLFPASLWLEPTTTNNVKLSHVGKGLLTHARLEALPLFGITTRTDTTQLDATHVVFGRVVLTNGTNNDQTKKKEDGVDFLQRVVSLPTYRDTAVPRTSSSSSTSDAVLESAAQSVFAAQRSLFKSTAQVLGDTRLDKVYPGKLLRRVEVTRVEYIIG